MNTQTDPLLEAVEALTKPQTDHIAQRTDSGRWIKAHTVQHPPLLQRMHEAVTPSGGNDGASKSAAAAERSLLDVSALYEYVKITSQIRSWLVLLEVQPTKDPVLDLQKWHVAHLADKDHADDWYIRILRGWAGHIRRLLDKPKSFTIPGACPVCGATEWGDMLNGGGTQVIKVEYRLDDDGATPKDHSALCQACKLVWEGHDAVMELADELTEKRMSGRPMTALFAEGNVSA